MSGEWRGNEQMPIFKNAERRGDDLPLVFWLHARKKHYRCDVNYENIGGGSIGKA